METLKELAIGMVTNFLVGNYTRKMELSKNIEMKLVLLFDYI